MSEVAVIEEDGVASVAFKRGRDVTAILLLGL